MNRFVARTAAASRYVDALVFAACVIGAFAAALSRLQDANWDLQNYHFYDPWAWLAGRSLDWDIAAAQLQTFHNPLADVPFYALVAAGASPRLITSWLALPTGIAAYFTVRVAWRLVRDLGFVERAGATAAAIAIGLTGAMGVGQLGSTTGEWLVTAFTMAALWLFVREPSAESSRRSIAVFAGAGLLMGVASGLKLTAATYAVGFAVALATRHATLRANVYAAAWFSAGVVAGLAIALGPWSYALWTRFDNPLFPYGNRWLRSPWWDAHAVLAAKYGPHSLREWLLLPFELLHPRPGFVSEVSYVDGRLPLLGALAVVAGGGYALARARRTRRTLQAAFRTSSRDWRFTATFVGASFVVWALLHSILRYTIPIEILSGVLIAGALGHVLRPPHATIAIACTVVILWTTTLWSDWGRVNFGPAWFDVRVPPVEPNALVLLTVDAPMSYVLPFFPADARHVGIRNNVIGPERRNALAAKIAAVVRDHRGPIYALSFPSGQGDADLLAHGLRRVQGACTDVVSNMPTSPIELCRVERIDAPA